MWKKWKNILDTPYPTLLLLRSTVMILLIGSLLFRPESNQILNVTVIVFFLICYLGIRYTERPKWIYFMIELFFSLLVGFLWVNTDFPYQLLIGLVGVGLFLYYEGKSLYISWAFLFSLLLITEFILYPNPHLIINYSFIVFASLTGGLIRYAYQTKNRFQALYKELDISYQKLQEQAKTVEKLAVEEERNRITREIHDTVGHTVTALIFQLEAARKLMQKDPRKSGEILQTTEGLARSIYQEIRFSIESNGQEQWDTMSLDSLIHQLIEDFSRLTQLDVTYQLQGRQPARLSREYKFTLYRILQETLTNAIRHGYAKRVWITLTFSENLIQLKIKDDGTGTEDLQLGFGLTNLQTRVESLAGTCHFLTREGFGFETTVQLPIKREE